MKKETKISREVGKGACAGYLMEKLGRKPKVGIFALTSCEGCQMRILDLEEHLLEIFAKIDVINFHLMKGENLEGPFDLSFVEGCVTQKKEIKTLEGIRKKSKYLIALGTCFLRRFFCADSSNLSLFVAKKTPKKTRYSIEI